MYSVKTTLRPFAHGCVAALTLAVVAVGPAAAQGPRVPLDARGWQTGQALAQYHQDREARTSRAPVAPAPAAEAPRYVSIRTPDGQVRYFLLEGPVTVVPFRPGVVAHYPRR